MCAPSSGGKFLLTELMTQRAIVAKFSSQAFCRTFLETIIQYKTDQYVMLLMFLSETDLKDTNFVSNSCSTEILQSLNYRMIAV
jgi:hypothetical protein